MYDFAHVDIQGVVWKSAIPVGGKPAGRPALIIKEQRELWALAPAGMLRREPI
jgi:hypothetical protein